MIKRLLLLGLLFAGHAQAAITYVGGAQDSEGANTNSLTLTLPTHQADDFCIIHAMSHDNGTDPVMAVTVASDWVAIDASPYNHTGGTDRQNYLWSKKLTSSSETSPVITTDTANGHSATLNCLRGVDTTTPFDAAAILAVADTINTANATSPAITTQTDGAAVLLLEAVAGSTTADTEVGTAPSGFTLGAYIDENSTPPIGQQNAWIYSAYDLDVGTAGVITPAGWAHVDADTGDDHSLFTIALRPAAAASIEFTAGPTVAAAANGYTISGTVECTGTCTVYAASWPPAASAPADCAAVEAASGALIAANEVWTTAVGDSFALTEANNIPRQDVYVCASDGTNDTAVTASADTNRSADANQTITVLASVAGTSIFALATDSTGDTTEDSFEITGMTDTSDFAVGMLVDVSAGFADLTDLLVTAVSASSITLEIASNATTADITVTSNVYFNPTVAAGDVVEADSFANPVPSDGFHDGSSAAATLTDSTASFTVDALINSRVANDTDGSACTITDNTATTVTCTLAGGTDNDWDVSDAYTILPLITWETDGDFTYTAFSGAVLTTIGYCIEDVSGATGAFTTPSCWTTDDVVYLFNTPPDFDDMGPFDDILVWSIDVELADVDMTNYCSDVDAHTLTFTYTGTPATGVTFNANGTVTGTPTVEDEAGAAMSVLCGDPGQLYARQSFTQYVIDTYTAPDCTDANTVSECAAEWDTAAPWYGDSSDYMTATFDYSDTVEAGDIISQDPVESTEVADPLAPIELVVSLGVEPEGQKKKRLCLGVGLNCRN